MLKGLKWLGLALGALLVMLVALWVISWVLPTNEAQRHALRLLHSPATEAAPGRNAYAAIWLLPYAVPEAEHDAVMSVDTQRFLQSIEATPAPSFQSLAADWPDGLPADLKHCNWQEDCLAAVRADPQGWDAALVPQQALLQRIAALSQYQHAHNPFELHESMPLPAFQYLSHSSAAHALAWVQGRHEMALSGVCGDVRTGRMLMSHSDLLITAMIGSAMVQGSSTLFSDMLAELPAGVAVPAVCRDAFTPPTAQAISLCPAMRGEFAFVSLAAPAAEGRGAWLLFNTQKTRARMAPLSAWVCDDVAQQAVAQDRPVPPPPPPPPLLQLECVANAGGCVLANIAAPNYDDYARRLQDSGAQLRLVSSALWLHDQAAQGRPADLSALPPEVAPARGLRLSADGRALETPAFSTRYEGALRAALPHR